MRTCSVFENWRVRAISIKQIIRWTTFLCTENLLPAGILWEYNSPATISATQLYNPLLLRQKQFNLMCSFQFIFWIEIVAIFMCKFFLFSKKIKLLFGTCIFYSNLFLFELYWKCFHRGIYHFLLERQLFIQFRLRWGQPDKIIFFYGFFLFQNSCLFLAIFCVKRI